MRAEAPPGIGQVDSLDKYRDDGSLNYGPALFVISYIVIVVWVLLQAARHPRRVARAAPSGASQ